MSHLKLLIHTDKKINVIKEIRTKLGCGLVEAKDMVEQGIVARMDIFADMQRLMEFGAWLQALNINGDPYAVRVSLAPHELVKQPVDLSRIASMFRP